MNYFMNYLQSVDLQPDANYTQKYLRNDLSDTKNKLNMK